MVLLSRASERANSRTHLQPHNLLRWGLSAVPIVGRQDRVPGTCGERCDFRVCWCVSMCVWARVGVKGRTVETRQGAVRARLGLCLPRPQALLRAARGCPQLTLFLKVPLLPGCTGPSTEIKFRASAPWCCAPPTPQPHPSCWEPCLLSEPQFPHLYDGWRREGWNR